MRRYPHLTIDQTLALIAEAKAEMAEQAKGKFFNLTDEDFDVDEGWFYEPRYYIVGVFVPVGDPETDADSEDQPTPFVSREAAARKLECMGFHAAGKTVEVADDLLVGFAEIWTDESGNTARLCVGIKEYNYGD